MNPDDDIEEAAAQMDEDFEDYKKKMAVGAYPEAEDVEEDVRKMQEKNPDVPEEAHRRLAVAYIAAKKRIKQSFRDAVTQDLVEPMMPKLFSGDLECVDSLPPLPDINEDEQETERRTHELEKHEKNILEQLDAKKAIKQIGDQAMQDVLRALENEQKQEIMPFAQYRSKNWK
jgi:hypothetical protein